MDKLKKFLETIPNSKILDVGTGRGSFISLIDQLYKDYEKIVGIDISDASVKMASKYFEGNQKIKIIKADINNCDFPDEHFDLVCLSNSLHHLEDKAKTFQSMERLVKKGGYLLFNEMMKDHLNKLQTSHLLLHHFAAKIDRELGRVHGETYNRLEIVEIVKQYTKFSVIEFWDMEVPKEEMKEEDVIGFSETVDRILSQIQDESIKEKYLEEANEIKEYILQNSVQACTQLLIILNR
ncbi:MAG: class I SAM-dependent methyltransferase [Tenericutes bacterium]|nr:class I SAM-dependent methyltransferase [Mycoplasmatota bacterium]